MKTQGSQTIQSTQITHHSICEVHPAETFFIQDTTKRTNTACVQCSKQVEESEVLYSEQGVICFECEQTFKHEQLFRLGEEVRRKRERSYKYEWLHAFFAFVFVVLPLIWSLMQS